MLRTIQRTGRRDASPLKVQLSTVNVHQQAEVEVVETDTTPETAEVEVEAEMEAEDTTQETDTIPETAEEEVEVVEAEDTTQETGTTAGMLMTNSFLSTTWICYRSLHEY